MDSLQVFRMCLDLDLSRNSLRSLPEDIDALGKVTRLDVSRNSLGALPSSLEELDKVCGWQVKEYNPKFLSIHSFSLPYSYVIFSHTITKLKPSPLHLLPLPFSAPLLLPLTSAITSSQIVDRLVKWRWEEDVTKIWCGGVMLYLVILTSSSSIT